MLDQQKHWAQRRIMKWLQDERITAEYAEIEQEFEAQEAEYEIKQEYAGLRDEGYSP